MHQELTLSAGTLDEIFGHQMQVKLHILCEYVHVLRMVVVQTFHKSAINKNFGNLQ